MTTAATVHLTVSCDAERHVAALGLQEALQTMLDAIPRLLPSVRAVSVGLQERYADRTMVVILEVKRETPTAENDTSEEAWRRWVIETFSPEVFANFCLLSTFE